MLALAASLLAGCASIGPPSVKRDRFDYVVAISDSFKRQTLLNLVKTRYVDVPVFMEIDSVINQYAIGGELGFEFAPSARDNNLLLGSGRYTGARPQRRGPAATWEEETAPQLIFPREFTDSHLSDIPRHPLIWLIRRGTFNLGGSSDSAIGYEFLQQFKLRLDYPRRRLWLKRRADALPTFQGSRNDTRSPPEPVTPGTPADAETPALAPAPTVEEQREAWQERMNERLFVFENGGWVVVEGWRRRMGPKEGEVWVTYDEMREMQRTGRVPEGASD